MFKNIIDFFLDLIFPKECQNCCQEGSWLCEDCFSKISFNKSQYCLNCKKNSLNGEFCSFCKHNFYLDGILIACSYNESAISRLIKLMKYQFAKNIAEDLAKILTAYLSKIKSESLYIQSMFDFDNSFLVCVPLHKKRKNWRGFNQAEIISEILSKNAGIELNNNLIRTKNTKPQVNLNAKERKENVKNVFAWKGNKLNNKNILLIDDVVTTGSTLNECAKILKSYGAGKIWALVIANGNI
jgi:competence protein ComFC